MLAGPIFSREALTAPRQFRHYLLRSGLIAALFVLMYTIRQATIGFQDVRNLGDEARLGSLVFQVFSFVQLSLVIFFALLFAASNIAQEKDRRTLILLLMTDMRDRELVTGKLGAGLLVVFVLLATSLPVYCLVQTLGGVGLDQVMWSLAICGSAALAAGAWGNFVAFWRDKTFQTLSIGVLGLVVFVGLVEALLAVGGYRLQWLAILNPFRAMLSVLSPFADPTQMGAARVSALPSVCALTGLAVGLSVATTMRLRVWNPTKINLTAESKEDDTGTSRTRHRTIWDAPIIWREIRTRAYGRRIVLIKLAYLAMTVFVTWALSNTEPDGSHSAVSVVSGGFVGISLLSFMLINAQAVTSLTTERDGKTLELLLVTDVTAQEFIFGKIGGVLFNTKELILAPIVALAYLWSAGAVPGMTLEYFVYITIGFTVLVLFSSLLGLHSGLSFESSRAAIGNSLGTVFFLFVGIVIFMILLVEARSSFEIQFQSFIVFIVLGSIGLYASLTRRNQSRALTIAAGVLPFLTFYAITEYLLDGSLGVCLWISVAYGFAAIAMLIPAISDFDAALGRTTLDQG